MNELKKTNQGNAWMIRLVDFPLERRKSIAALAARHRQSVGAYVATLLDEEIRKAEAMEEGR